MEKVKKITKKDNFMAIREILVGLGKTELVEVMDNEIKLLTDKALKNKANRKTNELGEQIKSEVMRLLVETGEILSIPQMQEKSQILASVTNQRISAYITQLKNQEMVKSTKVKGRAYFELVKNTDTVEEE